MSIRKLLFFAGLFLLVIFACKTQKQQPHRYVDYQPYFDQTRRFFVKTPSLKDANLDTSVQILSNLREEVLEFKDTVPFTEELEFSSGQLIIDINLINEKPPIYDTFMVVKDFLFKDELVNTLFPVIPDSIKQALITLSDSLSGQSTKDSLVNSLQPDSIAVVDSAFQTANEKPVQKTFYTREEILSDTTRDLFEADTIMNALLTDIPWKIGDSIPYFKGFSNYLMDSMLLLQTDFAYTEIVDTARAVKQYTGKKLVKESTQKMIMSDQFVHSDKVVFKIFYKNEEDVFIDMVKVQGGNFKIGSNEFDEDERPQYGLNVSNFLIGKYELTNQLFCAFLNFIHCDSQGKVNRLKVIDLNPRFSKIVRDTITGKFYPLKDYEEYPVVNVTWAGSSLFCRTMGGNLPSEAQWEYAARGGVYAVRYYTNQNRTDFEYEFRFAGSNTMADVGWFVDNSDGSCQYKANMKPNQLGLYDMSGNVWEWCYDNYNKDFYKRNGDSTDPICLTGSGMRVNRGGSWSSDAQYCRITNRNYHDEFDCNPYLGFRYMREWHSVH